MERFAIKIDKNLRANLYKICRLCGIDNPDKVKVLDDATIVNLEEGEPELWKKVLDCIGLLITKDDKLPQFMCTLCVDKINDFFEFREMCYATDLQTRKLLGIKEEPKLKAPAKISTVECKVEAPDIKQLVGSAQKPARKRRNADMEICGALNEIKVDDTNDIKPLTASTSLNSAKKKRLKVENSDTDTKPAIDTKTEIQTKIAKSGPASRIGLAKKALKIEDKKDSKPTKMSKFIKGKLKVENPPKTEDRRSTPFQLKKKKTLELLKQRKLAKQVAVVKVEKLRKASIDTKIKQEAPNPAAISGPNQSKVKLKEACTICSESFLNKTLLDKHIKSTHIPTVTRYHCVHCNETLKKNMEIKNHNLWHKLSKTPFKCGNCSETSCSIYTYTKHIRDCNQISYIDVQIPDWHCPECQGVYETTYLFNVHSCVSNTLVCPGCDRSHKWKEDFFKHIPTCAAAVHRIPSYMTPHIQVKNEAELPCSPIPQHHAQTLSTTAAIPSGQTPQPSRITPPLLDSNHCVVIPGNVSLLEEAPSSSPKGSCKKSNRITKKDLKRFDKLLKSTMTTLVSIKQEPTQCEGSVDHNQPMDGRVSSESPSPSPEPADDHFYDDDDESADEPVCPQAVSAIKQEIVDEGYRDLYINIDVNVKREVTENETINTEIKNKEVDTTTDTMLPKPVLKLKITKEHGTLNSILLDSPKSEKKKKKKKRKEEKHRERENVENVQREPTKAKADEELLENAHTEPTMPLPGIVCVKKEIPDPDYESEMSKVEFQTDDLHCVPSIVAATSGSLQIACVSEGVTFNGADDNEDRTGGETPEDTLTDQSSERESISLRSELQEPVDIKPRLEDLIPTLQIASVSSGEDVIQQAVKRKRGRPPGAMKATTSTPKILSVTSGTDVVAFESELDAPSKCSAESCEKVDNNENVFDFSQVKIKEEIVDPAFDDQDNQVPQSEVADEANETETETSVSDKQAEENAYIANIDFNNLSIKQEKEYIDDGLDNPVGFEDDNEEESDSDSDSSSDSDADDSESEREYRELPSENEETPLNAVANCVLPPIGLQISEVRSDFTCLEQNEKTESQRGTEPISGDTESNVIIESDGLDIPNQNAGQSVESDSPCETDHTTNASIVARKHDTEDSAISPDLAGCSSSLVNSESDLKADLNESLNSLATKHHLLDDIECNFTPAVNVETKSQMVAEESITDQLRDSFGNLGANPSNMFGQKEDYLITSDFPDLMQSSLYPDKGTDHFSPGEVDFTVMPVESTQNEQESPSATSTSKEEVSKSTKQSPYCSLTAPVDSATESQAQVSTEEEGTGTTDESVPETDCDDNLLNLQLSTMSAVSAPKEAESTLGEPDELDAASVSNSKTSDNILQPEDDTTPKTLHLNASEVNYNTSETFSATSSTSIQSEVPSMPEDKVQCASDEHPAMLMQAAPTDSLAFHLPSFVEAHPPNSQLFDATVVLDCHYPADLERPHLDPNESIDLSDVLSNTTLNAVEPQSNNHYSQSTVNDTTSNIPIFSSHMSSDTNFMNPSLNFTELCRNNSSLSSLSDFHINTSTDGHLHNLISPTDGHPPQLLSDLPGIITSSSTNNTDLNVPVLSEEVQNLLNEDSVAASNFELNDSILRARFSGSAPLAVSVSNFTDFENVNEIAENNNNANIERELQDELGNALAAAIADRSSNDEVDDNNAMNENRANFDLT